MSDIEDVRSLARPLRSPADLAPVISRVADERIVLLGEATHGTQEFYAWRDQLTRALLSEHGFGLLAVEGDWPDCRRLHEWIVGARDAPGDIDEALTAYDRWPTWMWANTAVRDAARWLRTLNDTRSRPDRVGFHGLDVYSLWRSMREVVGWLEVHRPELADAAREAYSCFEPFGEDPQRYARATSLVPGECEAAVLDVLRALCEEPAPSTAGAEDERFVAEQNAVVVAGAERYYRTLVRGGAAAWNVRDEHMADTLDRLLEHAGPSSKAVVWAHNTHVGDARATDMAAAGMTNLGALCRERHADEGVALVGFAAARGDVLAGRRWGAQAEAMPVPEPRVGSAEALFLDALGETPACLVFPVAFDQQRWLRATYDHRAIGVVYQPEHERWANYVPTTLGDRYDAMIWTGVTSALIPLRTEPADLEPETAPWGD